MRLRQKSGNECPQDCPKRSATCHATCEIHLAGWNERRAASERNLEQSMITDYTVKEVCKVKSGRFSNLAKYRQKEGRL